MKSSNNQSEIDKMSFWYFNNYLINFNEFLDKENGTTKGGEETQQDSASQQFQSSMNNAKSLMKKPSMSGFKMPKK